MTNVHVHAYNGSKIDKITVGSLYACSICITLFSPLQESGLFTEDQGQISWTTCWSCHLWDTPREPCACGRKGGGVVIGHGVFEVRCGYKAWMN